LKKGDASPAKSNIKKKEEEEETAAEIKKAQ
jgi:hypothetical protein